MTAEPRQHEPRPLTDNEPDPVPRLCALLRRCLPAVIALEALTLRERERLFLDILEVIEAAGEDPHAWEDD